MKKILSFIMAITILYGLMLSPSATGLTDTSNRPIFDDSGLVETMLENQTLIETGKAALRMRTSQTSLPVPKIYQNGGNSWDSVVLNNSGGVTIARAGCALTSFTMIHRYLGGSLDPSGMNTRLGNAAYPLNYLTAANAFGYSILNYSRADQSYTNTLNFCVGALLDNHPVLIGMRQGTAANPTNTHFVVARGYYSTSILIHDPNAQKNALVLSDYTSYGWTVDRLYVFA